MIIEVMEITAEEKEKILLERKVAEKKKRIDEIGKEISALLKEAEGLGARLHVKRIKPGDHYFRSFESLYSNVEVTGTFMDFICT